jgi:hypothetical protein
MSLYLAFSPAIKKKFSRKSGDFLSIDVYTHGSQSTLMAPQVLLPHSWMNFSIENTPVRSSTLLPHSLWRPLLFTLGSLEIHPM